MANSQKYEKTGGQTDEWRKAIREAHFESKKYISHNFNQYPGLKLTEHNKCTCCRLLNDMVASMFLKLPAVNKMLLNVEMYNQNSYLDDVR